MSSSLFVVFLEINSNFLIINLLIIPRKTKKIKKIPIPIKIWNISTPNIPLFQTDKKISEKLFHNEYLENTEHPKIMKIIPNFKNLNNIDSEIELIKILIRDNNQNEICKLFSNCI